MPVVVHLLPSLTPFVRVDQDREGRGPSLTVSISYFDFARNSPVQVHKLLYRVVDLEALASNVSTQQQQHGSFGFGFGSSCVEGSALAVENAMAELESFQNALQAKGIQVGSVTAGGGLLDAFGV